MPAPMTKTVAATAMPTVVAVLRPAASGTDEITVTGCTDTGTDEVTVTGCTDTGTDEVTVTGCTDTGTSDWLPGELVETEGLTVTSAGSEKLQTADGVVRLGGEAN